MKYDDRIIDQVQSANDIAELVGQYVTLKRLGKNLKACCPFHQEKTPSFMVQPEKQIFRCFGCGVGGDVFEFVMRHENMSFPEALRFLAERAHITLPEPTQKRGEGPSETEQLHDIYKLASEFYHAQFMDPVKGKIAQDYFLSRGFDLEMAKEFKMGWAPDGWRALLEYLTKKGFQDSLLLKSGLISRSPKGQTYDAFRARLLFPIANLQGKIVAFGGRILKDSDGPKYLNSPENPVFYKRRELFGLNLAKKFIDRNQPRIFVVEGYFGFMRLYQAGFKTTVATLGTSLTEEHVQLLKRFAEEAIVIYDGDKAGEAASLRGLEVFLEGGMNVKIAKLSSGLDPDDFIRQYGPEAFQKIIDEARDFFDYKLEVLMGRFRPSDSLGLMRITGEFLDTFAKIQNPVLVDRYLRKLAGSLGVEENSLRTELLKLKKKTQEQPKKAAETPAESPKSQTLDENLLLSLAIEENHLRRLLFAELTEADFTDASCRDVFQILNQMEQAQESVNFPKVLNRISNPLVKQKILAASSMEWQPGQKDKAFEDCIQHMRSRQTDRKLEDLRRSIAKAERGGNPAELEEYMKLYQDLWREHKAKKS